MPFPARQLPLNSAPWQFRDASVRGPWRDAVVPGCVHRDLRRHGVIPDPFHGTNELELQWIEEHDWEYTAVVDVPAALLAEEAVDLVCDGLDTVATVTLNGRIVAHTENMFIGYRWNVRNFLRTGANRLTLRFDSALRYIRTHRKGHTSRECNDPVGRCQVIRKQPCQFGWDWGPRFVTAGIWRDIRLEAWSGNRLEGVRVRQQPGAGESVILLATPELTRNERRITCHHRLTLDGVLVTEGTGTTVRVEHPQLWWPNGHGTQPLYTLELAFTCRDGSPLGRWSRRLGLRTVALDRSPDPAGGEFFRFIVNDRPLFAKGANWIPAHSFVAGLKRTDYARDLRAAAEAHMNMIRVWGGGIYESEHFYDLCDELGLLVWQDFMFACDIYPGDAAFRRSVRAEAAHQVRRLRHHACLALWSGNNEIEQINPELLKQPRLRRNYDNLFLRDLPAAVARHDGVTAYWPSSAHRPDGGLAHPAGERGGDTHFWDVWHARHPVKDYEKYRFRFLSEFGMQSYSSPETNATFCPRGAGNIFGAEMENHQKNRAGNQIILDYVSRRYRFPKSQDALIYLSQLNQAHCMQTGVEHWRRHMPHCMGALYWQLNDCWPVASWSSIEFTGHWRALHHAARRFFAPLLASAHVPGDETTVTGNYRRSTVREVHLYTVSDAPTPARGRLRWDLFHVDGRRLLRGSKPVMLRYGESVRQRTLDLAGPIAAHGRERLVLRIALDAGSARVSEESVFLTAPRFVALPRAQTRVRVAMTGSDKVILTFTSDAFQHRFAFELPGIAHRVSDNYFDLYPGEPKAVRVRFDRPPSAARLRRVLRYRSLVDTY
ncbi:MAG: glycoside hydrolase family 2 protein [Opitutae bacterium]|nr:glycoside hydrolase family 2 protein [Opitutae bacterium]